MESTFVIARGAASNLLAPAHRLVVALALAVAVAVALILLTAAPWSGAVGSEADTSYTKVEQARGQLFGTGAQDASYDEAEIMRIQLVLPNGSVDRSYDEVERIRSQSGN